MSLLTFRIIGHPAMPTTDWIDVGQGMNILAPATTTQAQALLHTVQAVNPPYECNDVDPFSDYPLYRSDGKIQRKIIFSKQTAVLALFAASPSMVKAVSAIDPLFYGLDRIELGRRRDYSWWMSFVELPASARWSEVAKHLYPLISSLSSDIAQEFASFIRQTGSWEETDRIKGERAQWLGNQLRRLHPLLCQKQQVQLERCLYLVARSDHFQLAQKQVKSRLPLFLDLYPGEVHLETAAKITYPDALGFFASHLASVRGNIPGRFAKIKPLTQQRDQTADDRIEQAIASLRYVAELHRNLYHCDPIVLVDCNVLFSSGLEKQDPLEQLRRLCVGFQCLIAPDQTLLDLCRKPGRSRLAQSATLRILSW